ncbi:type I restriction endonuclease subunit R [Deinococcus multiflagellatus]|uniref:Type I restriction enzyme endonuclease subunit n=2 Tax=Deinococcus multiflagellatus TaxID=1656887 RepID=A0ABW1ZL29_9DEIO|nr:type I restriction endonuclease subunit R [Deinococcus multiflagellatus]
MSSYNESTVELAALEWLSQLGFSYESGADIAPGESRAERDSFSEVLLVDRLRAALHQLNPAASAPAVAEAVRLLANPELPPNLPHANRELHALIVGGVRVELPDGLGGTRAEHLQVIDFAQPSRNSFLAVNQFTVVDGPVNRRPDVVLFVNGLPLVVLEFKNTRDEQATIEKAFAQLQTYQDQLPRLMAYNALLVISDGTHARLGVLGAPFERFQPWKTITGREVLPESLETLLKGALAPAVLLDLLRHFIVFELDGPQVTKKVAAYHQYHAVLRAVQKTVEASAEGGSRKGGVVWHTQGSGKSLSMVFFAGKLVVQPQLQNPTLVVLTDRNDLDDQLFGTFSRCADLLRQVPVQADSRAKLREELGSRAAGGVIFTTIQKFMPEDRGDTFPTLSERANVVVIADEAHRSQYGLDAKTNAKTGEISYGFAKHIRDALPNATFLGFTGTPIALKDADTRKIFGEYIDVYDVQRAVEDGATVPIYYEARLIRIKPENTVWDTLDTEFDTITEHEEVASREKLKSKWAALEALVGAPERIRLVAADLVAHFEARQEVMPGKGMIVGMSRRICVALYDEIIRLRPHWQGDGDLEGVVKVVMTGDATQEREWQRHIRSKPRNAAIADHFRKADSPLQLVIVRDMWLTGFDVPSLHTMYLDKPMQGHNLMQAIARVNRVFGGKQGGLVVDYLGLASSLKEALRIYTESAGQGEPTRNFEAALDIMQEKLDVVRGILHGFDYSDFAAASPAERVRLIADGQDFVIGKRQAVKERFIREVLALGQAYALAVPHPDALELREEIVYLQTVRAALSKGETVERRQARHDVNHAVQQLVERAVAPDGVVDVFQAAGLKRPDLSILSDGFLEEVRHLPQRNLAVELLERLLKDEIRTRSRRNAVESQKFSDKLEEAIARYQNRSIEAAQVIEELLDMAREYREAQARGENLGLSQDEIAFYDALGVSDSAVQVMGDAVLYEIAREIAATVRRNVTIDWALREQSRAKLRLMVKKVLKRYGYPPEKTDDASALVLKQAELMAQSANSDRYTSP